MKKQLAIGGLLWCILGGFQLPASADTVWFKTYDVNGDGLWSYPEYYKAEEHYMLVHPRAQRLTVKEIRRHFDDLDADHTGFVKIEQVRTLHDWD
jgi:Ca2+-binding EF-hand superfamily protein